MTETSASLPLSAYRARIDLDSPFVPRHAATEVERLALIEMVTEHLERDGTGDKLRGVLGETSSSDPRQTLKSLLTVRGPEPLPDDVHLALDAILQAERPPHAIVDVADLESVVLPGNESGARCVLFQGDITTLRADAVLNAANAVMLGCFRPYHPCIDNALHAAAGPRLREDCARIMDAQGHPEPTGSAKVTRAYNLPSRFVIHTVGPIVDGTPTPDDDARLVSVYRASLDLALEIGSVRSVVLCGVSTGVFGFPREPAARIAVQTVRTWLREHPTAFDQVVFNVFADADRAAYEQALVPESSR